MIPLRAQAPLAHPAVTRPERPNAPATIPNAEKPEERKLRKAASDFEAMAIGQLLQPMFDTVDTSQSLFGGGAGESAWKPMMVQEIAKHMAAHGGIGLAAPVYAAMLRMQEAKTQ